MWNLRTAEKFESPSVLDLFVRRNSGLSRAGARCRFAVLFVA